MMIERHIPMLLFGHQRRPSTNQWTRQIYLVFGVKALKCSTVALMTCMRLVQWMIHFITFTEN
jgi:hypothetical protein